MPAQYEFEIEAKSRRDLVTCIDMALIAGGARIGEGTYEVVVRRLSKAEVERRKEQEALDRATDLGRETG